MGNTNKVIIIGRLTRDAELKYTSGGAAVCKFSVAVNEREKSGESWVDRASFFDVTLWGRSAESLNQYLVKGKQVAVTGRLHQERWEQEGQSRSKVVVKAEEVELLGGGNRSDESGSGGYQSEEPARRTPARPPASSAGRRTPPPAREEPPEASQGDGYYPDDIPF